MTHTTVSKNYRIPIPEEVRQVVPLKPGQSVRIVADHGVITLVPDRGPSQRPLATLDLVAFERSLRTQPLDELAASQGIEPANSLEDLYGGWPEEDLDDGFEEAVRHWRDKELEPAE